MSLKRKAFNDLSTNSSTIKNRRRLNQINEHEKQLNDAKKANLTNEIYYVKKLKTIVK
jgi:hypothetical protein